MGKVVLAAKMATTAYQNYLLRQLLLGRCRSGAREEHSLRKRRDPDFMETSMHSHCNTTPFGSLILIVKVFQNLFIAFLLPLTSPMAAVSVSS